MKRRTIIVIAIVSSFLAAAPSAQADAVPFDVHYTGGSQELEAGTSHSEDVGLIGVCDREPFCTGIRLAAATSNVTAETGPATVTLRGYVCVRDTSAECSITGIPFTGVMITAFDVDAPDGKVGPAPLDVELCAWFGSPPETPDVCFPPPKMHDELTWDGTIADPVGLPSDLGLSF